MPLLNIAPVIKQEMQLTKGITKGAEKVLQDHVRSILVMAEKLGDFPQTEGTMKMAIQDQAMREGRRYFCVCMYEVLSLFTAARRVL